MNNEKDNQPTSIPVWAVANAIEEAVKVIRKARGKLNPEDCLRGSELHALVVEEFINDCIQSIGEDVEGEDPDGRTAADR